MLNLLKHLLLMSATINLRATATVGVAPGDESELCVDILPGLGITQRPAYPNNTKVLLDSLNYEALLPPQQNSVWQHVDLDNNNPQDQTTNWIQQGVHPCQGRVQVCGFSAGTQDNWLITQLINRTVNGVRLQRVSAQIEFETVGCGETLLCRSHFEVYKNEMSAVDSNAARHISNYRQVATVGLASANSSEQIVTFHIRFDTNHTSFYFAIRDVSWCLVISRVLIFYTVCQYKVSHLSIRPETIAPVDNTLLQVESQCVQNASIDDGGSRQPIAVCSQEGLWHILPGRECSCNPGFEQIHQRCVGCSAGTYFSNNSGMCQLCPDNSNNTYQGGLKCPCFDDYYRAMGEEDLPCTLPPTAPRNVEIIEVTSTSVSLRWDPPAELGGRDDFFYSITVIEGNKTRSTVVAGNVTTGTINNLAPGVKYQVFVIAENGITDRVPDHLQRLGVNISIATYPEVLNDSIYSTLTTISTTTSYNTKVSISVMNTNTASSQEDIVSVVTSSIVGIISVSMIILVVVGTCVILVCKKRNNSLNEDNHEYENINLSHVAKPLPLELPPSNVDIITKKNSAYGKVKLNKSRLDNEENKAELNDGYELVSLTELDSENQVPTN